MSRNLQRILLFLALAGLVVALGKFAKLRFQSGEMYPAYSTLRADPTGSKALYESLRRIGDAPARRNLEPLQRLKRGPGTTVAFLGVQYQQFEVEENFVEELARSGARVVVALDARGSRSGNTPARIVKAPPVVAGSTNTNVVVRINGNLLGLDIRPLDLPDTNRVEAVRVKDDALAPPEMFWFGYLRLTPNSNDWETVYTARGKPVVVERKLGLGSIVVVADSFPFSNEALHLDRQPEFLLWAFGPETVIFDETHLGVQQGSGVAVLMREFRLHGLAVGCLLLVGLWVWRNSVPFVPPAAQSQKALSESIEGKTAREAVVHLLRRNLTDIDVLRAGLEEWSRTHPSKEYWQTVRLNEARKLVDAYADSPKPRDLAAAQREISKILFPKRK